MSDKIKTLLRLLPTVFVISAIPSAQASSLDCGEVDMEAIQSAPPWSCWSELLSRVEDDSLPMVDREEAISMIGANLFDWRDSGEHAHIPPEFRQRISSIWGDRPPSIYLRGNLLDLLQISSNNDDPLLRRVVVEAIRDPAAEIREDASMRVWFSHLNARPEWLALLEELARDVSPNVRARAYSMLTDDPGVISSDMRQRGWEVVHRALLDRLTEESVSTREAAVLTSLCRSADHLTDFGAIPDAIYRDMILRSADRELTLMAVESLSKSVCRIDGSVINLLSLALLHSDERVQEAAKDSLLGLAARGNELAQEIINQSNLR